MHVQARDERHRTLSLSLSRSLARYSLMDCVVHVLAIRAHLNYESCSPWVLIMAKQTKHLLRESAILKAKIRGVADKDVGGKRTTPLEQDPGKQNPG